MSLIEEDVIFCLVAYERAEIFADDAVPVGAVLLIKLLLDVFGHEVFDLEVIHCVFCLCLGDEIPPSWLRLSCRSCRACRLCSPSLLLQSFVTYYYIKYIQISHRNIYILIIIHAKREELYLLLRIIRKRLEKVMNDMVF